MISAVTLDAAAKPMPWKMIHDLAENELARIHFRASLLLDSWPSPAGHPVGVQVGDTSNHQKTN